MSDKRKMGIVTYGSVYGTAKQYAKALAKLLDFDCFDYRDLQASSLKNYSICIHGGGLYAGGVKGLRSIASILSSSPDTEFFIFTVGLADPISPKNINNIRTNIKKQIPASLYDENRIFHLRGSIDYKKLSFIHKNMMAMMYRSTKKIPVEKQGTDDKLMIETYGQMVDFVDLESVKLIADCVLKR